MNTEVKARVIAFIGELDDEDLTPDQAKEASALYKMLTRKPGRQPKEQHREEASQLLAEAGPDGKELAS